MTFEELQQHISVLIDQDDEAVLRRFIVDHFKEFPRDIQGKLLATFLEETIDAQKGEEKIEALQREGIEAGNKISALMSVLSLPTQG